MSQNGRASRRSRRIMKEDQRKSAKSAGEILFENTDSQIQIEGKSPADHADVAEWTGLPQIAQIPQMSQNGRASRRSRRCLRSDGPPADPADVSEWTGLPQIPQMSQRGRVS